MSLDGLSRRLDKMLAQLVPLLPQDERATLDCGQFVPDGLITDSMEHTRLQAFVFSMSEKARKTNGHLDLRFLTQEDLDQWKLWLDLGKALQAGDQVEAQRVRLELRNVKPLDLAQLFADFQAIDLEIFNTPISPSGPINLHNYHRLKSLIERGQDLTGQDIDQVQWWVSYYQDYPRHILAWNNR